MAKQKTARAYELELKKMIMLRTGSEFEPWLTPQIRATAMNMVMLDSIHDELTNTRLRLADWFDGSTGQKKFSAHPLIVQYDKLQRTLLAQFEALGLNYSTTPSKVTEDTKKGIDTEKDGLSRLLSDANDRIRGEIPDL